MSGNPPVVVLVPDRLEGELEATVSLTFESLDTVL